MTAPSKQWWKENALALLQAGLMAAALLFNWGNLTGQTARDVAQVRTDVAELRDELKGVKASVGSADERNSTRFATRDGIDEMRARLMRIESLLLEDRRFQGRR